MAAAGPVACSALSVESAARTMITLRSANWASNEHKLWRERERESEIERDRQTDRQRQRQTDRQTETDRDRQTERDRERALQSSGALEWISS